MQGWTALEITDVVILGRNSMKWPRCSEVHELTSSRRERSPSVTAHSTRNSPRDSSVTRNCNSSEAKIEEFLLNSNALLYEHLQRPHKSIFASRHHTYLTKQDQQQAQHNKLERIEVDYRATHCQLEDPLL